MLYMKKSIFCGLSALLVYHTPAQPSDSTKPLKPYSLHFQSTIVNQYKLPFTAPYTGLNSLMPQEENRISVTSTFYAGVKLWKNAELYVNPELAGGEGLSQTLGLAGATNGETFRVGNPKPAIYLARLFYQQFIPLHSNNNKHASHNRFKDDDFNQIERFLPDKYINIILGKVSVADYFDDNSFSHDPRSAFLNWALMASAAWDYPADTRGYTPSLIIEFFSTHYECRAGLSMLPTTANGNEMNTDILKAHSLTLENVWHYQFKEKPGSIRLIAFYNTANMGNYEQALFTTHTRPPDIIQTRQYGRNKYGFAVNIEQFFNSKSGGFIKISWNDGHNETWAFTEIDHALSAGVSIHSLVPHAEDNLAIGYALNGISKPHRKYLKQGGMGFMLGDGQLNYAPENILETYYKIALQKQKIYLTLDYQLILNPGYNKDRQGPVHVFSVRTHIRI